MGNLICIKKDWKFYLGLTLFFFSFIPYLISGVVLFLKISIAKLLPIMSALVVCGEVSFAISVVLLGKPFVDMIKTKAKSFFTRPPEITPPRPIGRMRHAVGIWMFVISFTPYLAVEISLLLGYPREGGGHLTLFFVLLSGDALFMVSLFVLGDDFWQRLKKLFIWPGNNSVPAQ